VKVGDLVKRKKNIALKCGHGIVTSLHMAGSNPVHKCASVLYPQIGKEYDIAVSLIEVISES
jgi:hypothetical protein